MSCSTKHILNRAHIQSKSKSVKNVIKRNNITSLNINDVINPKRLLEKLLFISKTNIMQP